MITSGPRRLVAALVAALLLLVGVGVAPASATATNSFVYTCFAGGGVTHSWRFAWHIEGLTLMIDNVILDTSAGGITHAKITANNAFGLEWIGAAPPTAGASPEAVTHLRWASETGTHLFAIPDSEVGTRVFRLYAKPNSSAPESVCAFVFEGYLNPRISPAYSCCAALPTPNTLLSTASCTPVPGTAPVVVRIRGAQMTGYKRVAWVTAESTEGFYHLQIDKIGDGWGPSHLYGPTKTKQFALKLDGKYNLAPAEQNRVRVGRLDVSGFPQECTVIFTG